MESKNNRIEKNAAFLGLAALVCLPCCIPLIAPFTAWLVLSVFGAAATGWYIGTATVFLLGLAVLVFMRNRNTAIRSCSSFAAVRCGCRKSCTPQPPEST